MTENLRLCKRRNVTGHGSIMIEFSLGLPTEIPVLTQFPGNAQFNLGVF